MNRHVVAACFCAALLAPGADCSRAAAGEAAATRPAALPAPTDEAEQQYAFASGLYARKLYQESVEEYRRFLTAWPQHAKAADAHIFLGEALFSVGDFEAARRSFASFLQSFPLHAKADPTRVRMAACLFQLKKYPEAIALLEGMKNLPEPHASAARYYLGRSLQESGRAEEAEKALAGALAHPEVGILARFSLGELALSRKDDTKAITHFSEFIAAAPKHRLAPAATLRQAEAWRGKKDWTRALAAYRALPPFAGVREKRQAEYGAGWCALALNRHAEAETSARALLTAKDAELTDGASQLLGRALLGQKKYAEAAQAFAAVKGGTHLASSRVERLRALLLAGDHDTVVAEAPGVATQFPAEQPGTAPYLLGLALFRKGAFAEAATPLAAARAVATNPDRADAAWYLAICHDRTKARPQAVEAWRFFVTTFPAHPRLPEALQSLVLSLVTAEAHADAIAAARQLLEHKGASAEQRVFALRQIASSAFVLKDYALMEKTYRDLAAAAATGAPAREAKYWLAWSAQHQGKFADAAAAFGVLAAEPVQDEFSKRARYRQGMCLYQAGKHREAADIFYAILTGDPTIEIGNEELLWLGSWFVRNRDPQKADTVYESLLKLTNNPSVVAMALYRQAELRREQADWKDGAEKYRQLLARNDPNFMAPGWYGLGICQLESGEIEDAAQSFVKVRLDPADPLVGALTFELGRLAEAQRKHDLALRHYMRVALLYDDGELTGKALFAAAMLHRKTGQEDKALQCLNEILDAGDAGFARRHPQSPWLAKAKAALVPAAPATSAPSPTPAATPAAAPTVAPLNVPQPELPAPPAP